MSNNRVDEWMDLAKFHRKEVFQNQLMNWIHVAAGYGSRELNSSLNTVLHRRWGKKQNKKLQNSNNNK